VSWEPSPLPRLSSVTTIVLVHERNGVPGSLTGAQLLCPSLSHLRFSPTLPSLVPLSQHL
jgi:hypothetical protein